MEENSLLVLQDENESAISKMLTVWNKLKSSVFEDFRLAEVIAYILEELLLWNLAPVPEQVASLEEEVVREIFGKVGVLSALGVLSNMKAQPK